MDVKSLQILSNEIRKDIVEMLHHAGSGHSGGALGMADVFTVLYFDVMDDFSRKPYSKERDFVILSNGHICPVLYATLSRRGYFKRDELFTLRKLGSRLQGHPHFEMREGRLGIGDEKIKNTAKAEYGKLPGVENSGGPLGQGISQAVGLAASLKRDKKKNKVYCFTGDGELQEGQCYEACLFAAKENLDNLIIIIDRNNIQIDGNTFDVLSLRDLHKKFSNYGFFVIEFDGNDIRQIRAAFKEALKISGRPICFIANTIPGKGVSFMEKDFRWHGKAPNSDEATQALFELNEFGKKLSGGKK